ncbi:MAG: hypothetical protein CSA74_12180 [Rhodobacterales bacterium]|nr:MAG: hypothetical protein CSA74_12180 [Rhodobacterales bacterium]
MQDLPDLSSDCASCAALCCLALAFDAGEDFAFGKPAGLPCPNLDRTLGCTIHESLEDKGFAGCTRYDCNGAGQRVVQELFGGKSWRTHPGLTAEMIAAFAAMRQVHDAIELLDTAGGLDLPAPLEAERQSLLRACLPAEWTLTGLLAFADSGPPARLRAFLPRLREWV